MAQYCRLLGARKATTLALPKRTAASVLSPLEQKYYPIIGNREIVGYGKNGDPCYYDDPLCPYPSIRFQNHCDEIEALFKKGEVSWKNLSLDEAKRLYRHSFCRTIEETIAPHGIWKMGLSWGLVLISIGCLAFTYTRYFLSDQTTYVYQLPEYKEAKRYKQVFSRGGDIKDVLNFDIKTQRFRE